MLLSFSVFFSAEASFRLCRVLVVSRRFYSRLLSGKQIAPSSEKDKNEIRIISFFLLPSLAHFFFLHPLFQKQKKLTSERDGHVSRVLDDLTRSSALELDGNNAATTSVTCPPKRGAELGVTLPHVAFLLRAHSPGKGCSLEVEVRDDRGVRRRIRASTFQPASKVAPGIASLPLRLEDDEGTQEGGKEGKSPSSSPSRKWHRVPLDLDALVRRAWGTRYRETLRVTVHACCRLRRVYFSDRGYEGEAALPPEYKLYIPASAVASVSKAVVPAPPASAAPAAEEEEEDGDEKEIPAGAREVEVATGEVAVGEEEEEEGGREGGAAAAAAEATASVPVA